MGNFHAKMSARSLDFSSSRDVTALINEDLKPSDEMERYLDSVMFWTIGMRWPPATLQTKWDGRTLFLMTKKNHKEKLLKQDGCVNSEYNPNRISYNANTSVKNTG